MLRLRFTLLIGMLCLVSSVMINEADGNKKIILDQNLQFENYTAWGVDQKVQEKFLDTIRKGYLLHRDIMRDNILYIRSQLESYYSRGFTVVIYDRNMTGGFNVYAYNSTLAIWNTVISQEPQWVYVIVMGELCYGNDYEYMFGQGSGINSTKLAAINNIITATQQYFTHPSQIATYIGYKLESYDGGKNWSVITVARNTTIYASINDYNHQYYIPSTSVSSKYVHLIFTYKA